MKPYTPHHKASRDKRFQAGLVNNALKGIVRISPRTHLVRLSGDYSFAEVSLKLGRQKRLSQKEMDIKSTMPVYTMMAYLNLNGNRITIYYAPEDSNKPYSFWVIPNSNREILEDICYIFPDLTVSLVEYAIDFFCESPEACNRLFWLFCRYSWFPQSSEIRFLGDAYGGYEDERKRNTVYQIHYESTGYMIRIYDRGEDSEKNGKLGWDHHAVNRVRWELAASYRSKILQSVGIHLLRDLCRGPQFRGIIFQDGGHGRDRILFCYLENALYLPAEYEDFVTHPHIECFQHEFIQGVKRYKNIYPSVKRAKCLDGFKHSIEEALFRFDEEWRVSSSLI